MMKLLRWMVLILCLMAGLSGANAQNEAEAPEYVEAEGLKPTRQEALDDAKRQAVEQGVGVWLKSQTVVVNLELKKDIIETVTKGYVVKYDVISERQEGSNIRVRIRALVSDIANVVKQAVSDVQAIIDDLGRPRLMVMLSEQNLGKGIDEHPAESAIIEELVSKEFEVVDRDQVNLIRAKEVGRRLLEGDKNAAWLLRNELGAEIFLVGLARSEDVTTPSVRQFGRFSAQGRIELKAIWAETGQVIMQRRLEQLPQGVADVNLESAGRQALAAIAKHLLDDEEMPMIGLILRSFKVMLMQGRIVEVQARGFSYNDMLAVKKVAERYKMWKQSFPIRLDTVKGSSEGKIRFQLKYPAKPDDFVAYLAMQTQFPIVVTGVQGSVVMVKKKVVTNPANPPRKPIRRSPARRR